MSILDLLKNVTWSNVREPASGIFVTARQQPEEGAVMLLHCNECRVSEFVISPHAVKPKCGDYWRVEYCPLGKIHMDWPLKEYSL